MLSVWSFSVEDLAVAVDPSMMHWRKWLQRISMKGQVAQNLIVMDLLGGARGQLPNMFGIGKWRDSLKLPELHFGFSIQYHVAQL